MAGILELSDDEFKATVMDMLRPKTDKVDSIQEKMGSVSRRKKILRKKKEMLEIKDTKTEIKNILKLWTKSLRECLGRITGISLTEINY